MQPSVSGRSSSFWYYFCSESSWVTYLICLEDVCICDQMSQIICKQYVQAPSKVPLLEQVIIFLHTNMLCFSCYSDYLNLKPSTMLLRPHSKGHYFPFLTGKTEDFIFELISHWLHWSFSPLQLIMYVGSAFCLRLIFIFMVVQNTLASSKTFLHPSFFMCIHLHLFIGYISAPFFKKVYESLKSLKCIKYRKKINSSLLFSFLVSH